VASKKERNFRGFRLAFVRSFVALIPWRRLQSTMFVCFVLSYLMIAFPSGRPFPTCQSVRTSIYRTLISTMPFPEPKVPHKTPFSLFLSYTTLESTSYSTSVLITYFAVLFPSTFLLIPVPSGYKLPSVLLYENIATLLYTGFTEYVFMLPSVALGRKTSSPRP